MLTVLTKKLRVRAAITLAALYAFCLAAPPVALAFVDGATAAHCLFDDHGIAKPHEAAVAAHVHADGTAHRHHDAGAPHQSSKSDGDDYPATCCGLFCLTALTANPEAALAVTVRHSSIFSVSFEELVGRGPDRINRPPISLLPI